ncbi:BQ2448_6023 [Microbotryum intermedium]|uniref:BQ2448_6023 protein n=1 Tax=Microbotryum intermedium TaxID=269621 RepID=A0A238F2U8_9BASI|nr:BQ2448_6023 [Microbotryum intermedium]
MPPIDPTTLSTEDAAPITSFVSQSPNSNYTLNERVAGQALTDLCRLDPNGQTQCVQVHKQVTKVFALMQKQGFLCQLPSDPSHTELFCQRIQQIVARQS